jgi:hypothetical protein
VTEEVLDLSTLSSDEEVKLWMRRKADAKVAGSFLDPMGTSSNEDEEHALPSALRANDIVRIRLATAVTGDIIPGGGQSLAMKVTLG